MNFAGIYRIPNGSLQFKAIGYIVYMNTEGTNTPEYPFSSFPKLEMTLTLCSGSERWSVQKYMLTGVDHLNYATFFSGEASGSATATNQKDMKLWYTSNWDSIEGLVIDPETPQAVPRPDNPPIQLKAVDHMDDPICLTPIPN